MSSEEQPASVDGDRQWRRANHKFPIVILPNQLMTVCMAFATNLRTAFELTPATVISIYQDYHYPWTSCAHFIGARLSGGGFRVPIYETVDVDDLRSAMGG
jgi:hypothetical protein